MKYIIITKEKFIDIMTKIKNDHDFLCKVEDLFGTQCSEHFFTFDIAVDLLSLLMDDMSEELQHFCWELDFGRDDSLAGEFEHIPNNFGELYDMLMENKNGNQN